MPHVGYGGWGGSYSYYRSRPYYGNYYGSYYGGYPYSYGAYPSYVVGSTDDSSQNATLAQHQREIDDINLQNSTRGDWLARNWWVLLIVAVLIAVVIGFAMRNNGYHY